MNSFLLPLLIFTSFALPQVREVYAPELTANLPAQKIGPRDLIAIQVYDSPELTRSVRVGADGLIRLPMLRQRIKAEGLMPGDLETVLCQALEEEGIIVDPLVTV